MIFRSTFSMKSCYDLIFCCLDAAVPAHMKCSTAGCNKQKCRNPSGGYFNYCSKYCRDNGILPTSRTYTCINYYNMSMKTCLVFFEMLWLCVLERNRLNLYLIFGRVCHLISTINRVTSHYCTNQSPKSHLGLCMLAFSQWYLSSVRLPHLVCAV